MRMIIFLATSQPVARQNHHFPPPVARPSFLVAPAPRDFNILNTDGNFGCAHLACQTCTLTEDNMANTQTGEA